MEHQKDTKQNRKVQGNQTKWNTTKILNKIGNYKGTKQNGTAQRN